MALRLLATLLASLAIACATPRVMSHEVEPDLDIDDAPYEEDVPAVHTVSGATIRCWFGELMVGRDGADESYEGELLVKLTVDPSQSIIVEDTFAFPLFERFTVTRKVHGNSFTLEQDDGAFTGKGALEGDTWAWNAWTSTAISSDQTTRVESETRLIEGELITRENILAADGSLRASLHQALVPVPVDECNRMFAKAQAHVDAARR